MTSNQTRPAVLDKASETQIDELERHFEYENRHEWDVLTDSYGWTKEQSQNVWDWFGVDPERKQKKQSQ